MVIWVLETYYLGSTTVRLYNAIPSKAQVSKDLKSVQSLGNSFDHNAIASKMFDGFDRERSRSPAK